MNAELQAQIDRLSPAQIQRIEWYVRLVEWIVPRLKGDDAAKEQCLAMIDAALKQSHNDGIEEAASVAHEIRERTRSRDIGIIADALTKLAKRNRADGV